MNIIKKLTKETVLVPYRVVQGVAEAIDEVVNGEKKPEKGK